MEPIFNRHASSDIFPPILAFQKPPPLSLPPPPYPSPAEESPAATMVTSIASPRKFLRDSVFKGVIGSPRRRCSSPRFGGAAGDFDDGAGDDPMEMVQLGAERTKNVLILMSDTGGGHRASAEAIKDAFRLEFGDEYRVCASNSLFYFSLSFFFLSSFQFFEDSNLEFSSRNARIHRGINKKKMISFEFMSICAHTG